MHYIDWLILIGTLLFIVLYGTWKTRKSSGTNEFFRGNNEKWWTIGLSVMATQASAITFLSTPGQAYEDGMGFVQFYFGLPLAMVIICLVFVPIYHKLKVYTAYEFLEERFNLKTRTLAAVLFLIQRGLSAAITIFAPSIILSTILGWDLYLMNFLMGVLVIIYTVAGGTRAVNVTHKQQMAVIFGGLIVAFFVILSLLPDDITFDKALSIADANGKMNVLNFSFDPSDRYTFWSGITGGLFLALAYFGTDQSQVQRYLSGKSIRQSQMGLMFNAVLKIPMQFFILLIGVMVYVFFQFNPAPLNFNPRAEEAVLKSEYREEYQSLQQDQRDLSEVKIIHHPGNERGDRLDSRMALKSLNGVEKGYRDKAKELIQKADPSQETNDKDYIFIYFILNYLPVGLIGLLIAVIFCAAMSSTAAELSALASITAMDLYKRHTNKSDEDVLKMSRWFVLMWGVIAILLACFGTLFENLIQFVNIVGSIFYGNVLGIFLLAFFFRFVRGNIVFWSAVVTQLVIFGVFYFCVFREEVIGYLWLNAIGCVLVMFLAIVLNAVWPRTQTEVTQVSPIEPR